MRFGICVPTFANPGVPYFRTPNLEQLEWQPAVELVLDAERLGFDSFWVGDHMFLGRDGAILEGWTTLSALAALTKTMRFGPIHFGNGFHHAPLVAKAAATLDLISGGRLEFFIDPGWREREFLSYGFPWESELDVRVARLAEAIELTKELWSGKPVTFSGRFYELDGAICEPTPVQAGGPPIWLGEALDEASLQLIASAADVWNSIPASPRLLAAKIARVDEACERHGRDASTLRKTLEQQFLVYEDKRNADRLFERFAELRRRYPSGEAMEDVMAFLRVINPQLESYSRAEDFYDEFVIGTPDEVAARLHEYRELGIDEVMGWFMDFPERESLELFASAVMPQLRDA